jgi:hypothetical protein
MKDRMMLGDPLEDLEDVRDEAIVPENPAIGCDSFERAQTIPGYILFCMGPIDKKEVDGVFIFLKIKEGGIAIKPFDLMTASKDVDQIP